MKTVRRRVVVSLIAEFVEPASDLTAWERKNYKNVYADSTDIRSYLNRIRQDGVSAYVELGADTVSGELEFIFIEGEE